MTDLQRRVARLRVPVKWPVEMSVRHNSHPGGWDGHIKVVSEHGGFVEIGGPHAVGTPRCQSNFARSASGT